MEHSDHFSDLVSSAKEGKEAALDTLFSECRDYLLLIANQDIDERLLSTHAPSDLVQTTLARANEKFDQFEGTCRQELLGWVRAILKNELKGTSRKQLQTQKRAVPIQPNPGHISWLTGSAAHPIDPQRTPATEAELEEEAARLRRGMMRLSEDYRRILIMRNWQRDSFEKIAKEMQRSENAVKKLWARALVALERELSL